MVDETKLLRRLQDRDSAALEEAISLYTPYLSTVIYRAVGNALPKEDVEEALSDTFLALWRSAGRIDPDKGSLRAYTAAAARNFALKRIGAKRDCLSLDELEVPCPSDSLEQGSLWDSVMSLGEPDSEIFVRFYRYGEGLREISAATGLRVSAIKSRLSRGRRKLKQILTNAEGS